MTTINDDEDVVYANKEHDVSRSQNSKNRYIQQQERIDRNDGVLGLLCAHCLG